MEYEELEKRISVEKLKLLNKGRDPRSHYSQRANETESSYQARLYVEARTVVRSAVRATQAAHQDGHFDEQEAESSARTISSTNQEEEKRDVRRSLLTITTLAHLAMEVTLLIVQEDPDKVFFSGTSRRPRKPFLKTTTA